VLDVAAGAGDQTLDVAARVGPQGHVLATDLSPDILQFAAQQAAAAGYRNVETRVSDGEKLQIEDAQFDAVVCRLGLMLFGDPLQGLREMARVLKPGGGVCTIVFGAPQANPCVTPACHRAIPFSQAAC
jgi:ubiquinone/menaquinone biosynthesis C-methylase UbiE